MGLAQVVHTLVRRILHAAQATEALLRFLVSFSADMVNDLLSNVG